MFTLLAYFNGEVLPRHQVTIPLHDAGFVMGATVTDLCRTVKHRLYRWEDHLARFRRSCDSARIRLEVTDEELTDIAHRLICHNTGLLRPELDLALVLFATPGPIGYYAGLEGSIGDGLCTLGMHTFPLPFARYRRLFHSGAHLAVPTTHQVSSASIDPRIKQRSRLHWWLADRELQTRHHGAIALLLNEHGHVTETAAANLLIVRQGNVLSPPRDTILNGISLLVVEELCQELSIPFVERTLTVQDVEAADEVLLSNTSYCICGVSRFNDKQVPWPGKILERLLETWSQRIGLDIRAQIESVV